ncbi:integral membrane protein [Xylariaceae sp. FL0016]|nr:integral membrane protein [Xylariaceae sp. FL0016]
MTSGAEPRPPTINYVVGFLMVGLAWGLTTPFIRRAAKDHNPPAHSTLARDDVKASWFKSKVYGAFFAVVDLLKNPRYAVPLLINLTGSVWFFLLIGQAGMFSRAHMFNHRRTTNMRERVEFDGPYCEHTCVLIHGSG